MSLSKAEVARYARHIVLKGFGAPAQQKLKQARILVIGAGGLGSPAIAYLAAAGAGQVSVADDDVVSISNLQRQIIHRMDDLGVNKAHSAQRFARDLNPETDLLAIAERLDDTNCDALVRGHDVVLDGTDRYRSRQTIARACARAEIPLVSGAVNMFDGQLCVFAPHLADANGQPSPRFHDLYPTGMRDEDFPACEATGILGASTGVIGSLMAMEAIKLATGVGEPLIGRLLMYDGRHARFTELEFSRMAEDR